MRERGKWLLVVLVLVLLVVSTCSCGERGEVEPGLRVLRSLEVVDGGKRVVLGAARRREGKEDLAGGVWVEGGVKRSREQAGDPAALAWVRGIFVARDREIGLRNSVFMWIQAGCPRFAGLGTPNSSLGFDKYSGPTFLVEGHGSGAGEMLWGFEGPCVTLVGRGKQKWRDRSRTRLCPWRDREELERFAAEHGLDELLVGDVPEGGEEE